MHEKYEKAINLIRRTIELKKEYDVAEENKNPDAEQFLKNTNIMFLKLINHLNKTFPAPVSINAMVSDNNPSIRVRFDDIELKIFENEISALKNLFEHDITLELLEKQATDEKNIPEYLFPIAVTRYLFQNQRVVFDTRIPFIVNGKETFPWRAFSERYVELMIKV